MSKSLLMMSGTAGWTNNRFNPIAGSISGSVASEATAALVAGLAGTFSLLQGLVDATGTARSLRFRKNSADGTLLVSPTDTTAGLYTDAVNSDTLAAGDTFDHRSASTGGSAIYFITAVLFAAAVNHACYYGAVSLATVSAASTTTYGFTAGLADISVATEANTKQRVIAGGLLKKAYFAVTTNARTTDTTIRSRVNGADGNIAITCTALTTATFSDTSNSDTIASGDDINFSFTTGSGTGNFTVANCICAIENTSSAKNDLFMPVAFNVVAGVTRFIPIAGGTTSTTEANNKVRPGIPATLDHVRARVSANASTTNISLRVRKNGANGNGLATITALTTGVFTDTTNSDTFAAADDMNFSTSGGTTSSATIQSVGVTMTDATPGAATARGGTLLLMGV